MIGLFPEFVAQVTGYVRSPRRQDDLHLLVDVGAGTVDVTTFNVHRKDDIDTFPIFSRDVRRLGANYLFQHRLKETGRFGAWQHDQHAPPPNDAEFAGLLGISIDELHRIDGKFTRDVHEQIYQCLVHTKTQRYPKSPRWREGIPVFFCGGGSRVEAFEKLFARILEEDYRFKLVSTHLPIPSDLIAPGLPEEMFHRMSVAYGLAFDAFDIGEVVEQDKVKRDDPEQVVFGRTCGVCRGTGGLHSPCRRCGGTGFIK
jgi:hypothetical protein